MSEEARGIGISLPKSFNFLVFMKETLKTYKV